MIIIDLSNYDMIRNVPKPDRLVRPRAHKGRQVQLFAIPHLCNSSQNLL